MKCLKEIKGHTKTAPVYGVKNDLYLTPARTHSISKWTKISSLDIIIFEFKNDGEKWSRF